jgi:hypothetical protein
MALRQGVAVGRCGGALRWGVTVGCPDPVRLPDRSRLGGKIEKPQTGQVSKAHLIYAAVIGLESLRLTTGAAMALDLRALVVKLLE